ncbi:tetratricopeptide repeat protein 12 [Chelonus insularis]|uniref:tetratricopeptide repeat protein 12 n=1 Tax=Chelonus insularis TaxID=460826 RepID=UPI00158BACCC|nr:tetratricopeptide repeat protein 12 [Chelonus insularis]
MSFQNNIDEEFNNFMCRATEVEKVIKKLVSNDIEEQNEGMKIADSILDGRKKNNDLLTQDDQCIVKCNRTIINNKNSLHEDSDNSTNPEIFMKMVEKDANQRAQDKKIRDAKADNFKKIGNNAFNEGDYVKAITYYEKALEERKDSALIWNNCALAYMKLELYDKALNNFNWALRINDSKNIKALLNSAKCHALLGNRQKCDEFIILAKDKFPKYFKYISDFENELKNISSDVTRK